MHGSPSSQSRGGADSHTPAAQTSWPLHASRSPHGVPSVTGVLVHPATGSHWSTVHGSPSSQPTIAPGMQTPAWHDSVPLHTVSSEHDVPSGTAACTHPWSDPQVSSVHGLPSSQSTATPLGTHEPP